MLICSPYGEVGLWHDLRNDGALCRVRGAYLTEVVWMQPATHVSARNAVARKRGMSAFPCESCCCGTSRHGGDGVQSPPWHPSSPGTPAATSEGKRVPCSRHDAVSMRRGKRLRERSRGTVLGTPSAVKPREGIT